MQHGFGYTPNDIANMTMEQVYNSLRDPDKIETPIVHCRNLSDLNRAMRRLGNE